MSFTREEAVMSFQMGRRVSTVLLPFGLAILFSTGTAQAQCQSGQRQQNFSQQRTGFQPQNGYSTFMPKRNGNGFNLPVGLQRQQPMGFLVGLGQQQPNGFPVGLQQQQQNGFLIALQQQKQQNGFLIGLQQQQMKLQTPLERQQYQFALQTALQQTGNLQIALQQYSGPDQIAWLNIFQGQSSVLNDLRQQYGQ